VNTRSRPHHLRILLATDGSPDARTAAEWLARFPLPEGAVPLVLSVVSIPPSPIAFPGLEDLKQSLLADGRRACEEAADALRPRCPAVQIKVVDGDARMQILRTAATWKPHLAVLGRRGLGGLERMLLGPGVEVHLVVVSELPVPTSLSFAARETLKPELAEVYGREQGKLRDVLKRAAGRLEGRPVVHTHTPVGDPARQLLEMSATADLVVVGSRGLGAVRRLLLGSVSEKVLQHAPCSVMIVKDPG
jgi:nucleotide-binding universal stress UspA family protein